MDIIMELMGEYRLLSVFVGSFFFGDAVIITSAYLAGQLHWNIATVFLAAFAGTVASDIAWFVAGRVMTAHGSRITLLERQRAQIVKLMDHLTGRKLERALVYVKFLYGGRIAMILYAASQRMKFSTFMIYNSLGIFLWFVIFFPLGYVAGRGLSRAMSFMGVVEAALLVFVASFVIIRIFNIWLTYRVEKE